MLHANKIANQTIILDAIIRSRDQARLRRNNDYNPSTVSVRVRAVLSFINQNLIHECITHNGAYSRATCLVHVSDMYLQPMNNLYAKRHTLKNALSK